MLVLFHEEKVAMATISSSQKQCHSKPRFPESYPNIKNSSKPFPPSTTLPTPINILYYHSDLVLATTIERSVSKNQLKLFVNLTTGKFQMTKKFSWPSQVSDHTPLTLSLPFSIIMKCLSWISISKEFSSTPSLFHPIYQTKNFAI